MYTFLNNRIHNINLLSKDKLEGLIYMCEKPNYNRSVV
ncbi:hypothetical protein EDC19_0807 [Natranaerovirga hydrolytica]|uniref:Uncharacterized protein n=1 Tax=Natranaerovirga hydrolytica TaxID=680378 RepID=A0A4R1MYK7_9FIRM|nr:hypothetical protein EDC19_0807 [Natranaerovirga hydrolytica]